MDLSIFETHDGGDVVVKGNDFELTNSIWNHIYIGLFGGNVAQSTEDGTKDLQERFDFWGNELFFQENIDQQFNSNFERELQNAALTSAGIQRLEAIAKDDLKFLNTIGTLSVDISITDNDRIKIDILLQEPGVQADQQFTLLWDGTRLEEIKRVEDRLIPTFLPVILIDSDNEVLIDSDSEILIG